MALWDMVFFGNLLQCRLVFLPFAKKHLFYLCYECHER